jgi:DNA-binding CsgD family transcriptional regulator
MLEEAIDSSPAGPVRGEALYRLGRVRAQSEGIRAAERLYLQALAESGVEIRVRVHLLCELAFAAAADGRDGSRYAESGLALAEQAAEPELLVFGLAAVSEMAFDRTGCIRHDLLDRGLLIERTASHGRRYWRESARNSLASLLGLSNRFDEARAMWKELIAEDYELADPRVVWDLRFLAELELASGAWDEAARLCEEAMEAGRQTGRETIDLLCQRVLAEIAAFRGEEERARREIPRLRQVAERTNGRGDPDHLDHALGVLELSCGDAEASWRQVEPWFADLEVLDEALARLAGSVAIEALIAIGDLRTAERLLMLLDDYAAEADTAVLPLAARCRGVLRAARGDFEPAIVALEAAAADPVPPQQASPFELARTLLALGTVQRKAQHKRDARESLERAAEIFERLGARIWLENARSELARIGGRVAHEGELSETERRIVELVVAGRRNREVAAELSLSPNTVAWNLSKVYRKLGVSSRTELAAQIAATPPA